MKALGIVSSVRLKPKSSGLNHEPTRKMVSISITDMEKLASSLAVLAENFRKKA